MLKLMRYDGLFFMQKTKYIFFRLVIKIWKSRSGAAL